MAIASDKSGVGRWDPTADLSANSTSLASSDDVGPPAAIKEAVGQVGSEAHASAKTPEPGEPAP
jgi:hypothetical protein